MLSSKTIKYCLLRRNVEINISAISQIRLDVIFRKVTFGNRSYKGAENHSVLTSILQAIKLNKLDPLTTLQNILLSANKNPLANILAPPYKDNPFFIKPRNKEIGLLASIG